MERIRLTQRMAARNRKADSAEPETAIDLGKNRTYHKIDEYHTFEPSLNHWEPDMRHEWKEDKHDETGFGIPKMAKVYMAAKKATKLAMMLLGEDANEQALEKQARAFMRMGDKALTASIERWAECNCGDGKCEEACDKQADEAPVAPAEAPAPEAPVACGDKEPVACPVAAEEEAPVPAPTEEAPATEAPVEEAPAEEAPAEAPAEASAEDVPADVDVDEAPEGGEVDFDDDVADTADTGADAELESVFEDDAEEASAPAETTTTASKKSGVKKLAGQPTLVRVASKNADDLAGIWDKWSNPDVR